MIEGKKVGYARVSKTEQNLDSQVKALENYGCDEIFKDKATGTDFDREEFRLMVDHYLEEGDTIVIYSLDRFGRNTLKSLQVIYELRAKGIKFECITTPLDFESPYGKFFVGINLLIAELERDLIVERVKRGQKNAMAQGRMPGPKKGSTAIPTKPVADKYKSFLKAGMSHTEADQATALHFETTIVSVHKYLDMEGVERPKGRGKNRSKRK